MVASGGRGHRNETEGAGEGEGWPRRRLRGSIMWPHSRWEPSKERGCPKTKLPRSMGRGTERARPGGCSLGRGRRDVGESGEQEAGGPGRRCSGGMGTGGGCTGQPLKQED